MTPRAERITIVGASGMLGHRLVRHFRRSKHVTAVVRRPPAAARLARALCGAEIAVESVLTPDRIAAVIETHAPDVVINAAGLIKQRPASCDPVAMIEANALLPRRLAAACRAAGVRLIHISSDCVFSGARGNYAETDVTDAQDLYGRSKALGEPVDEGALTLRTSIIGPEIDSRFGLLEWFRSRAGAGARGYARVIFPGLPTVEVARLLETIVDDFPDLRGLYHAGAEPISKDALLRLVNERYRLGVRIEAVQHPVSDRSLDCRKFREATGWLADPWPVLVDRMARDEEDEEAG